jgi:hypothetical protein
MRPLPHDRQVLVTEGGRARVPEARVVHGRRDRERDGDGHGEGHELGEEHLRVDAASERGEPRLERALPWKASTGFARDAERLDREDEPDEDRRRSCHPRAREAEPREEGAFGVEREQKVERRESDADDVSREPHGPFDGREEVHGPERQQERQRDVLALAPRGELSSAHLLEHEEEHRWPYPREPHHELTVAEILGAAGEGDERHHQDGGEGRKADVRLALVLREVVAHRVRRRAVSEILAPVEPRVGEVGVVIERGVVGEPRWPGDGREHGHAHEVDEHRDEEPSASCLGSREAPDEPARGGGARGRGFAVGRCRAVRHGGTRRIDGALRVTLACRRDRAVAVALGVGVRDAGVVCGLGRVPHGFSRAVSGRGRGRSFFLARSPLVERSGGDRARRVARGSLGLGCRAVGRIVFGAREVLSVRHGPPLYHERNQARAPTHTAKEHSRNGRGVRNELLRARPSIPTKYMK